jgi:hypothetical protein
LLGNTLVIAANLVLNGGLKNGKCKNFGVKSMDKKTALKYLVDNYKAWPSFPCLEINMDQWYWVEMTRDREIRITDGRGVYITKIEYISSLALGYTVNLHGSNYPLDDKGLFFDSKRCKKCQEWGVIDSTCKECKKPVELWSDEDEARQEIVESNGNTGEHYATKGQGIIKQE